MMEGVFISLSQAVEGAPALALTAALLWGVLSILLSPCHLASIPLIVGYISDQERVTLRHSLALSGLFAIGILATIGLIGAVTASLGRMMGDVGVYGNYAVAGVFFLVGLHLLGVIPMPWSSPKAPGSWKKGYWPALFLGLIFGIALGPCTFAYMAPMLAVVFRLSARQTPYAVALLLAYGIGHCSVIVLAGTSAGGVQRYLKSRTAHRGVTVLKRICGVLVLCGGFYLVYSVR